MDTTLLCNNKRCQTPLSSYAWITSCSHIFCDEHCPSELDKKCPLCSSDLSGTYDLHKKSLYPSEQHKSMILAGLDPSKILEIGNIAMTFWKFQMFQEKMLKANTIKQLRIRLAKSETSYQTITERLKDLIQQEAQKCEDLQKEMNNYMKKIKDLEEKIERKNIQLYNAHMKIKTMERQAAHYEENNSNKIHRNNVRYNTSPDIMKEMADFNMEQMFGSQKAPTPKSGGNFGHNAYFNHRPSRVSGSGINLSQNY